MLTYRARGCWACTRRLFFSGISGLYKSSNLVCPKQSPPHSCICLSCIKESMVVQSQAQATLSLAHLNPCPSQSLRVPPIPSLSRLGNHLSLSTTRYKFSVLVPGTASVSVQCSVTTGWGSRGYPTSCCLSWKWQALSAMCLYVHRCIEGPSIRLPAPAAISSGLLPCLAPEQ